MKNVVGLCLLLLITLAEGGHLTATASRGLIRTPSLDGFVVKSSNQGGNFAYRTIESRAYLPPTRSATPVTSRQIFSPYLTYTFVPQAYYPQSIFSSPIYPNQIASAPIYGSSFYPGSIFHPVFAHPGYPGGIINNPVASAPPVISNPVVGGGQVPILGGGQGPILGGGQVPIVGGGQPGAGGGIFGDFPVQAPAPAAPTPVQGTIVDDDTVAIESA